MKKHSLVFLKRSAILLCLLLIYAVISSAALAAARESDIPDSYPSFTWKGYKLIPIYSEVLFTQKEYPDNKEFFVRVACDEMPLSLLYGSSEQFMLSGTNSDEVIYADSIRVMEGTLQKKELFESCEFFDLIFTKMPKLADRMVSTDLSTYDLSRYELTAEGADHSVPLPAFGSTDPLRCGFRTKSGLYVLSFYTENAYKKLLGKYNKEWKKKNIRLCLGGSESPSVDLDRSIMWFLNACSFSRVSLTLGHDINLFMTNEKKRITDLMVSNNLISSDLPELKKLTFRLGDGSFSMPDFKKKFPGLTELNVICCVKDPSAEKPWDYMQESSSTGGPVAEKLKKLTFLSPEDDPFTLDPDVRIWLTDQQNMTPNMTVNGKPAKKIDFTAGLEGEDRTRLAVYTDLKAIEKIYDSSLYDKKLKDRKITGKDIKKPVFFAVRTNSTFHINTDGYENYSYTSLSDRTLAPALSEAKTIVFIYPSYEVSGTYYSFDTGKRYAAAQTCYTHIAVMSYQNGKARLIAHHVAYEDAPPGTIGNSDSTRGKYYVDSAVEDIVDLIR